MKDYVNFVKVIKDLKFYIIEFIRKENIKHEFIFNKYIIENLNQ